MNVNDFGTRLSSLLGLSRPAVSITFQDRAPAGVSRVSKAGPAGCAYWKLAGDGQVFYTEAADHYNCPVGSYTHGVDLPAERAEELQQVVGTFVSLQYIAMEEVPAMPRRTAPFGVAVYAPLEQAPVDPDVVLIRGDARQIMLIAEAARAAGIGHDGAAMGRPACSMIPQAMNAARGNTSLGCIGNRVYTGLGDAELYFTIPGARLGDVVAKLETIVHANQQLEQYHQHRKSALA